MEYVARDIDPMRKTHERRVDASGLFKESQNIAAGSRLLKEANVRNYLKRASPFDPGIT